MRRWRRRIIVTLLLRARLRSMARIMAHRAGGAKQHRPIARRAARNQA